MSSALDSLQKDADQIDALMATFEAAFKSLAEKLNTINPTDPGALEQIAALQAEYTAARSVFVDVSKPLLADMRERAAALPDDEKQAGIKIYNGVYARIAANAELAKSTFTGPRDTKKAEAQAAVDAKNKEVEDNAAKTPEQTDQQNKAYVASGAANDDKGGPTQTNSNIPVASKPGTSNTLLPHGSSIVFDPITITGKKLPKEELPGRRLENPLGNFSSYTYQLSLYMITPDAYTAFMNSNRTDINTKPAFDNSNRAGGAGGVTGAFLLAQSGGINSTEKRAPGFEDVDFFIDDLKITQATSTQDTGSDTNTTSITFNVYEPYGFSFITRMRTASNALAPETNSTNYQDVQNPSRQFFVLGIQFLGYDENGNLIDSSKIPNTEGDPSANANALFRRYYDITISKLKFKIDGKMVVYNIEAVSTPQGAVFGQKNGIVWNDTTLIGETVYDVLTGGGQGGTNPGEAASSKAAKGQKGVFGLLTKLNRDAKVAKDTGKIEIENEYDIKFMGDADFLIKEASIISKADLDKRKWAMNPAITNSINSNESTAASGIAVPNPNLKELKIASGTPIIQAINAIITQSEFMESRLLKVYQSTTQPDVKKKEFLFETNEKKVDIEWFNIGAQVEIKDWDKKQGDWAYKITYIIQLYQTPVVVSAYDMQTTPYYGPQKRYNYWFTGKNSEVLKYEQQMDNNFYVVALDTDGAPSSAQAGPNDVPVKQGQPNNQPTQGRLDVGLEAQNSYLTSLYDTSAYATAKIQILGDPDFLMQTSPTSIDQFYHQFYGTDGFSISPNGGQTFIEIDFKEPRDYDNNTGRLTINDSIYFWRYPKQAQDSLNSRGGGVIYQVRLCVSTFSKGKFIQDLECNVATFGDTKEPADEGRASGGTGKPGESQMADTASRVGAASTTTSSTGVGSTSNTGFGISPPSVFADPAQLGGAGLLGSVGSINNVLDPMQKLQNAGAGAMGTIQTKLGPVADNFGRG